MYVYMFLKNIFSGANTSKTIIKVPYFKDHYIDMYII